MSKRQPYSTKVCTLNQTPREWRTRVVTLTAGQGLKERCCAALSLPVLQKPGGKWTTVMHSGLVGSSLATDQHSPFVLWRATARETGPNCSAAIATVQGRINRLYPFERGNFPLISLA